MHDRDLPEHQLGRIRRGFPLSHKLELSVVDQSPVRTGESAGQALRDTIALAVAVEKLGYQRYWLAEHHSLPNFAGTSPEIMLWELSDI